MNTSSKTIVSNTRIQSTKSGFFVKSNNYARIAVIESSNTYSYIDFSGKMTGAPTTAIICKVEILTSAISTCTEMMGASNQYIT